MAQARTLNARELRRVLEYTRTQRYGRRNRLVLLLTHWAGMRIGEVAALRVADVLNQDGSAKAEIRLEADQTKGSKARVVFVSDKLRKEIASYAQHLDGRQGDHRLIATQKREGFSANTLAQTINTLYQRAGVEGASSHSGRRTFITTLANKGVGVRVLASLAGHQSISTTQRYIDVNDGQKRAAVELLF